MDNFVELGEGIFGPHHRSSSYGPWRRHLRRTIHFFAYNFILNRRTTRVTQAGSLRLTVRPTVFHPRFFVTSEFFVSFIRQLDLTGKRVADVGTGSGILALAAARAGAANVTAVDINPNAVLTTAENARANGFETGVTTVCSNLLSELAPDERFDVILSNPPFLSGEPRDLADRAWYAGADYRDIAPLFGQARERLTPGGRLYILVSSDSDLDLLSALIAKADFKARLVAKRSILIESFMIYELRAVIPTVAPTSFSRHRADCLELAE